MLEIGQFNHLTLVKRVDFGAYLDAGQKGSLLLPKRYLPANAAIGDVLKVFVYFDSDDALIATTETPLLCVGQTGVLTVKQVNNVGAFMDWGLMKDVLVPFAEQHKPFEEGKSYVVTLYQDKHTGRILGSSKLHRHLSETAHHFQRNEAVDLLIYGRSDMGYKAVINHRYIGLIFRDAAFKPLHYGQQLQGYIKGLREDGKIDLSLQKMASAGHKAVTQQILDYLNTHNGISELTDKSPPEAIYHTFNVSKANFKKAIGTLLKQNKITLEPGKVLLVQPPKGKG